VYLKRLEMFGFKSFAARTELEFSPGITAIVGPNGSGKSNIADAVRWVLGEQSMKQLRGRRSEDIIFAGGQGRAALGMSEVSLTLDNTSGWLPSEYTEVTVTRRSYRSGENEYLINRNKVRLRDVLLLLAQARVGHDSYTVIGQGSVDAALSLRAEERRSLFEDAAGIRHFQVQRADAEAKLAQTAQNLYRLRDIIAEIEPRLAPLAEQAHRAQTYMTLSARLEQQLTRWYAIQWRQVREACVRAETAEAASGARQRDIQMRIEQRAGQMAEWRARRMELQRRQEEVRRGRGELLGRVQALERDIAVVDERCSSLRRQQEELATEREREQQILRQGEARIAELVAQLDRVSETVSRTAQTLTALTEEMEHARRDQEHGEAQLRAAQREVIAAQARLGAAQSELGRLQRQIGERNRILAARRQTVAQARERLADLTGRMQQGQRLLDEARSQEQELAAQRQKLRSAGEDAQRELERLRNARAEMQRQRRSIADRLALLRHWQQSLGGYSDGARALLRAGKASLPGIIGPLANFVSACEGMETAIEAALGPLLQALLVRSAADAVACLRYLDQQHAGTALLVWDDETLPPQRLPARAAIDGHAHSYSAATETIVRETTDATLGMAVDFIRCAPEHASLFQRLLAGCVVVRDLAAARALLVSDTCDGRSASVQVAVTLAGEVVHRDGWVSGGKGADEQGMLARARELRALPAQLEEHDVSIAQLDARIADLQRQQDERRAEQARLDRECQRAGVRIAELNRELGAIQREVDRAHHDLQVSQTVEQDLAAEIAGLEQELHAAEARVAEQERAQREAQERVEQVQRGVEAFSSRCRAQQEEVNRQRTALAVQRQEQATLAQRLEQQRAQSHEVQERLNRYHERVSDLVCQEEATARAAQRQRAELDQIRNQVQQLTAELRQVEEAYRKAEGELRALDELDATDHRELARLEGEYRRCLVERQRWHDALEHLHTQMREELGMEEAPVEDAGDVDAGELRRAIDNLRGQLKDLGGYDPDAPREYEETRVRHEFLASQVQDMERASEALRKVIAELDETMKRQFAATFQAISERFGRYFAMLFRGGSARLELTPPKDPETHGGPVGGVEVIVQLPGKKLQDLSLLSGGERALVSAALLFALLETNPPPFCLLDEVDAALDESNVVRFCDILRTLAEHTQFIVITHNRLTMTEAQVIYGVSMGADSVSRLLSLRLAQIPA